MARKVAVVGLVLALVGGVLLVWGEPASLFPGPRDGSALFVWLLLTLGRFAVSVGALTIALALLIRVTGRSPVMAPMRVLLGTGMALLLLAPLAEATLVSTLMSGDQIRLGLALLHGLGLLHEIGALLLALWLTGLLVARAQLVRTSSTDGPGLDRSAASTT